MSAKKFGLMKKNKKNDIRWGRSLTATVLLILVIGIASWIVVLWISRREEEKSFDMLKEEAGRIAAFVSENMSKDREELELIAYVAAGYEDMRSKELWELIDSFDTIGTISKIEILLPDNTVVSTGGKIYDAEGILSFPKESVLGKHITDCETDIADKDKYVVRHYVPIVQSGKIVAMLCGVVELGELPEKIQQSAYGQTAALYIIDGNTGDFLVDTWHPGELGNIWAIGKRELAPGYTHEQLQQGITNGETGYVVFVSKSIGEYLYFYHQPIGVNNWQVALSVSESLVFESADKVKNVLNLILLIETVCFVLYFLWMVYYVKKVTNEKQRQLDMINYVYDVETLLFNAHEKRENIISALGKIARLLGAERVGFWMINKVGDDSPFLWKSEESLPDQELDLQKENVYSLLEYFAQGNSEFIAGDQKTLYRRLPDNTHSFARNIMAVSVKDMEGEICGILVSCNMNHSKADISLLKSVRFSFSMLCYNLKKFDELKEQGEKDALTGLYNRNRYEADLPHIRKIAAKSLACIYIDVNGLHELNNTKGHELGDIMLKAVADQIKKHFGTEYTYRIGGDEFLVFVPDEEQEKLERKCILLSEELQKEYYHISVGLQWQTEVPSLTMLVKAAEKKMYDEKRKYYEFEQNKTKNRSRSFS